MIYLDTSVVLLILLKQEGASSAKAFFERLEPAERVLSSILLRIEVSRALHREGLPLDIAKEFFDGVETVDIHDAVVERACALTGELKSLDAIHLATATLLDRPRDPVTVLTHDARLETMRVCGHWRGLPGDLTTIRIMNKTIQEQVSRGDYQRHCACLNTAISLS